MTHYRDETYRWRQIWLGVAKALDYVHSELDWRASPEYRREYRTVAAAVALGFHNTRADVPRTIEDVLTRTDELMTHHHGDQWRRQHRGHAGREPGL